MASPLQAQETSALAVPAALALGLPLVVQLLAARNRKLDFSPSLVVEVKLERDDGHAFALDSAGELADLTFVEQEFAGTLRRMIESAGLQIFRDVGVDEPDLAGTGVGV